MQARGTAGTRLRVARAGSSIAGLLRALDAKSRPTDLDESQVNAVRQALERRVSLVVGPPGTGKTFIAMRILELHRAARVLVLTHKNRCLDDFLYQYPGEGRGRAPGVQMPAVLSGIRLMQGS